MFNLVIEQLPGQYIYISHSNPAIDFATDILPEVFAHFRHEEVIPPDLFTSRVILAIAARDSKKKPSFRLSVSSCLGENGTFILGLSFPTQRYAFFHENGKRASSLLSFPRKSDDFEVPRLQTAVLKHSNVAPVSWDFSIDD
jgi:hypothetical protein